MVEVIFLPFFRIIGGSRALDDVQPNAIVHGGKLGCGDARVNRCVSFSVTPPVERGPLFVPSTAASLQTRVAAVLTVASLSHQVLAL